MGCSPYLQTHIGSRDFWDAREALGEFTVALERLWSFSEAEFRLECESVIPRV